MATTQAFSDSMENNVLDVFFRNQARTHGDDGTKKIFIALCTATITEGMTGATIPELPNANGYTARQQITFNSASGGVLTNSTTATFTCSGTAWNPVISIALCDTSTIGAGNHMMYDNTITSVTLNPGDTLAFNAGQVTVTLT